MPPAAAMLGGGADDLGGDGGAPRDAVYAAFLETAAADAVAVNADSDTVRLAAVPGSGEPPSAYDGVFREVEHFERAPEGTVFPTTAPVRFRLSFEPDYLRSSDPRLQFRVARIYAPIVHPNVSTGLVCLGDAFRPGTSLRGVVDHLYRIVAGRVRATHHALDADGQRFFLQHMEEVERLGARPLWRRRLAQSARVEGVGGSPAAEEASER
jgi:ubiquitin-protein ligase